MGVSDRAFRGKPKFLTENADRLKELDVTLT